MRALFGYLPATDMTAIAKASTKQWHIKMVELRLLLHRSVFLPVLRCFLITNKGSPPNKRRRIDGRFAPKSASL